MPISTHKKKTFFDLTTEKKKERDIECHKKGKKKQQQQQEEIHTKICSVCRENVRSDVHELRDRNLAVKLNRPSPKQAELTVKSSENLQC